MTPIKWLAFAVLAVYVVHAFDISPYEIHAHDEIMKKLAPKSFPFYPMADSFVIKQTPDAFVGYEPVISLHAQTHLGFLEFDVLPMTEKILSFGDKLEAVLRLYIKWFQNEHTAVELWHVELPRAKWSDASLKWSSVDDVDEEIRLGVVYSSDAEFMEYDITTFLKEHIDACSNLEKDNCRYLTFRLQTDQPSWVKFISKDASEAEQAKRPSIRIHQDPWPVVAKCVADATVSSSKSTESFGTSPSLELQQGVHEAYLLFDLSRFVDDIRNIAPSLFIKLRLYATRTQEVGSIDASYVTFRDDQSIEESELTWAQASEATEEQKLIAQEVYPDDFVEFDLTTLLKGFAAEESNSRLRHVHIRLQNRHSESVKFASSQYHDTSKRPMIVFTKGSFWHDEEAKPRLIWLRRLLYSLLSPWLLFAVVALSIAVFGFGPQISRAVLQTLYRKTRAKGL